jgi:hypothetical protein
MHRLANLHRSDNRHPFVFTAELLSTAAVDDAASFTVAPDTLAQIVRTSAARW